MRSSSPRTLLALAGIVILGGLAPRSARALEPDFQVWSQFVAQKRLTESFTGVLELFPRFTNDSSELGRLILRPALVFHANENRSFSLGWFWMGHYDAASGVERRPWVGYQERLSTGPVTTVVRTRFEARNLPYIPETVWRVRQLFRFTGPLSESVSWVAWNELFFQFNSAGGRVKSGFDQNRLLVGTNLELGEGLTLEPGYLMNYIEMPGGSPSRVIHALWTAMMLSL